MRHSPYYSLNSWSDIDFDIQPKGNNIPNSILIAVCRFLPTHKDRYEACLVNCAWNSAATSVLWECPTFSDGKLFAHFNNTIQEYIYCALRIRDLQLCVQIEPSNTVFQEVNPLLHDMHTLDSHPLYNFDRIKSIVSLCENLTSLTIYGWQLEPQHIHQLYTTLKRLRGLTIIGANDKLRRDNFDVNNYVFHLSSLSLFGSFNTCPNFTSTIVAKYHQLTSLKLSLKDMSQTDFFNLREPGLAHRLEKLTLTDSKHLNDYIFQDFIGAFRHLKKLCIEGSTDLSGESVKSILEVCLDLEYLEIRQRHLKNGLSIKNQDWNISKEMLPLRSLILEKVWIHDLLIENIAYYCGYLTTLGIKDTGTDFTDQSMINLLKSPMNHFRYLNLIYCPGISSLTLLHLPIPSLYSIHFESCGAISPRDVFEVCVQGIETSSSSPSSSSASMPNTTNKKTTTATSASVTGYHSRHNLKLIRIIGYENIATSVIGNHAIEKFTDQDIDWEEQWRENGFVVTLDETAIDALAHSDEFVSIPQGKYLTGDQIVMLAHKLSMTVTSLIQLLDSLSVYESIERSEDSNSSQHSDLTISNSSQHSSTTLSNSRDSRNDDIFFDDTATSQPIANNINTIKRFTSEHTSSSDIVENETNEKPVSLGGWGTGNVIPWKKINKKPSLRSGSASDNNTPNVNNNNTILINNNNNNNYNNYNNNNNNNNTYGTGNEISNKQSWTPSTMEEFQNQWQQDPLPVNRVATPLKKDKRVEDPIVNNDPWGSSVKFVPWGDTTPYEPDVIAHQKATPFWRETEEGWSLLQNESGSDNEKSQSQSQPEKKFSSHKSKSIEKQQYQQTNGYTYHANKPKSPLSSDEANIDWDDDDGITIKTTDLDVNEPLAHKTKEPSHPSNPSWYTRKHRNNDNEKYVNKNNGNASSSKFSRPRSSARFSRGTFNSSKEVSNSWALYAADNSKRSSLPNNNKRSNTPASNTLFSTTSLDSPKSMRNVIRDDEVEDEDEEQRQQQLLVNTGDVDDSRLWNRNKGQQQQQCLIDVYDDLNEINTLNLNSVNHKMGNIIMEETIQYVEKVNEDLLMLGSNYSFNQQQQYSGINNNSNNNNDNNTLESSLFTSVEEDLLSNEKPINDDLLLNMNENNNNHVDRNNYNNKTKSVFGDDYRGTNNDIFQTTTISRQHQQQQENFSITFTDDSSIPLIDDSTNETIVTQNNVTRENGNQNNVTQVPTNDLMDLRLPSDDIGNNSIMDNIGNWNNDSNGNIKNDGGDNEKAEKGNHNSNKNGKNDYGGDDKKENDEDLGDVISKFLADTPNDGKVRLDLYENRDPAIDIRMFCERYGISEDEEIRLRKKCIKAYIEKKTTNILGKPKKKANKKP
ncbi:unnamed protein product [Cunninghamella echinulata]